MERTYFRNVFLMALMSVALAGCGSEPLTMIVGTYTDECASRGVYSYYFDQEKGMLFGGDGVCLQRLLGRSVGLR